MKKTIYRVAAVTFAMGMILTNCSTPTEKVEKAEANVAEANKDLDKAQEEYLTDIDNCRKVTDEKIAANDQSIADFKTRIANEKKDAKADYNNKIADLEQKNSDMKKRWMIIRQTVKRTGNYSRLILIKAWIISGNR